MPVQKYPCRITNANFVVDNSLNLHIIRFYRRNGCSPVVYVTINPGTDSVSAPGFFCIIILGYFLSRAMISSATFLPERSIPPKMGPMRGVPETAEAAIPQT